MLKLDGASCGFRNRIVLNKIDAEVASGSLLFVLGPNGAGKSTLLRSLAGTLPLLSGQIRMNQLPVHSKSSAPERPAFLPSQVDYSESLYGGELLDLYPSGRWQSRDDLRNLLHLAALEDRRLIELSSGERQRLFLAATLSHPSNVVILDEPLSFLDPHHQFALARLIENNRRQNRSFIISAHQLDWCLRFSNSSAWLLNQSSIALVGRTENVLTAKIFQQVFGFRTQIGENPMDKTRAFFVAAQESHEN